MISHVELDLKRNNRMADISKMITIGRSISETLLGVVIYLDMTDKELTAPTVESMIKLL